MAEHTPGPWMIDPKYLSEIQTADDRTICSAWHQYASGQEIVVTGVLECSLEESAANARLIASAPDLLELAFQYRDDLRHPPAPDSRERRLAAIDAVIAKAIA